MKREMVWLERTNEFRTGFLELTVDDYDYGRGRGGEVTKDNH